jgi:DNA-binding FadR family transcriptional regulator
VIADASKLVILGIFLRTLTSFGEGSVLQRLPFDADYAHQVLTALSRIRDALAAHDPERARAEMLILRHESEQHWQSQGEPLLNMPLRPFEFGR